MLSSGILLGGIQAITAAKSTVVGRYHHQRLIT